MAIEVLKIDANSRNVLGGLSNDGSLEIRNLRVNPTTNALQVETVTASGTSSSATKVDEAAYTVGTDNINVIGGVNTTDTVSANVAAAVKIDSSRNLSNTLGTLIAGEDQNNNVLASVMKPLAVTTYSLTWDDSVAAEASSVVKASPGNAYFVFGFNNNAAVRYFQIYNSTTVPADTAVPVVTIAVAAGGNFSLDMSLYAKQFTIGMAWANSTTLATKTVGGSDFWVNFGYV